MSRKSYEPAGSSSGAEYYRRAQDAVREALFWKEKSKKLEKKLIEIGQERTHLLLTNVCTTIYHACNDLYSSIMYYN